MGRIIYSARDDTYQSFGREMRGLTDRLQSGICRAAIGSFDDDLWAKALRCGEESVTVRAQYGFGGVSSSKVYLPDGSEHDGWTIGLNTLAAVASESVKLLARIHAQCELHCWFSEDHREWFKDQLAAAIEADLLDAEYRAPLIEWLGNARGPIVLSYSVCDEFPSPAMLEKFQGGECAYEAFEQSGMSEEQLFDECLATLQETPSLRITPENNAAMRYGSRPCTIWDVERSWRKHLHQIGAKASTI